MVRHLRRVYFPCRYGQLHVRTAFPPTGGFDEQPPLICLHEMPRSSRSFIPFISELALNRSVYACDTPGFGESDPVTGGISIENYAAAIDDVIRGLRLRSVDVLGVGLGAAIAAALALIDTSPVRRVIMVHPPLMHSDDDYRWLNPKADGSHLMTLWRRSALGRGPTESPDSLTYALADELHAGLEGDQALAAMAVWVKSGRLSAVKAPTLVLGATNELANVNRSALPMGALTEELPALSRGLSGLTPAALGTSLRRFLDR
jgi:pimeloyl-ACP methyl ester carboxylesterase